MATKALNFEMAGVDWKPIPDDEDSKAKSSDGQVLRATHSGIWNLLGQELRVYQLENGQCVIHKDDADRLFKRMME